MLTVSLLFQGVPLLPVLLALLPLRCPGMIVLYCSLPEIAFGLLLSLGEHIVYLLQVYNILPCRITDRRGSRLSFIIRHAPEDFYLQLPGLFLLSLLLLSCFLLILPRPFLSFESFSCSCHYKCIFFAMIILLFFSLVDFLSSPLIDLCFLCFIPCFIGLT